MRIANGVEVLEISTNVMGTTNTIYPTLIYDNDAVILVDAGYPGQLTQFREAMEKAGVPFDKLSKVILTHHDIDHIGSLSSIQKESSDRIEVLAHKEEAPYIQGDAIPTKLAQLEANLDTLPVERKALYEKLKAGFQNSYAPVDGTLSDGEELPYCGGITIIYTPGHTPGHICLYLKQSKTLIAGDIFGVEEGRLVKSPPHINFDLGLSAKSIKKLTTYDIETVVCYHGGLYSDNVNGRIAELAKE